MTKYCSCFFAWLRSLFSSKKEPTLELNDFCVLYGPPSDSLKTTPGAAAAPRPISSPWARPKRSATLIGLNGELEGKGFLILDRTMLGRDMEPPHIAIPKSEQTVARRHAQFCYQKNGRWAVTNYSLNGITLNGLHTARQKPLELKNGDIISFGPCRFGFYVSDDP